MERHINNAAERCAMRIPGDFGSPFPTPPLPTPRAPRSLRRAGIAVNGITRARTYVYVDEFAMHTAGLQRRPAMACGLLLMSRRRFNLSRGGSSPLESATLTCHNYSRTLPSSRCPADKSAFAETAAIHRRDPPPITAIRRGIRRMIA